MQVEETSMIMTRTEHLDFCKKRALEYLDAGDIRHAFTSMASDLRKHDDLANHIGTLLGAQLLLAGHLETPTQMRKWIEGFN